MENSKSEISAPTALLCLCIFLIAGFYAQNKTMAPQIISAIKLQYAVCPTFWIILTTGSFLNCLWGIGIISRRFGLTGQGARLRTLRSTGQSTKIFSYGSLKAFAMGIAIGCGLLFYFDRALQVEHSLLLNQRLRCWFVLQPAIFLFLIYSRIDASIIWREIRNWFKPFLPIFPELEDQIVLGSTDEDKERGSAKWLSINHTGLTGGVLITGSIGCGKTQGAVLPYLEQVLKTIGPMPSVLAIDPKRVFIAEAKKIVKSLGQENRLRILSLEGQETFNPVYVENILMNSRFMDVAEMVRASAVNFSGDSVDSPFWEISAFNLMKNVIVYCAATRGYFTFRDIYDAIVRASTESLSDELETARIEKSFNSEELYNVDCAITYFKKEYQQLDDRLRTGILATATSFLNQFQEFRAAKIFCPPQNRLTISSMKDLVDRSEMLFFDIESPALARSMGTVVKLHFERSVLDRLNDSSRPKDHPAVLICDEYQDVVTSGGGKALGDERFQAKCREANAIFIVASQSLTSIMNSVGKEKAAKELIQNFRTRIACHSLDAETVKNFQEIVGQRDVERVSHSFSETTQSPTRNIILGGFDSQNANISESVNVSKHREFEITGKEFSRLETFEAFAIVYDGARSVFSQIYLKPQFLKDKRVSQPTVLKMVADRRKKVAATAAASVIAILSLAVGTKAFAFPSVCEVIKQPQFRECLGWKVQNVTCGIPPHPCARISYFVPQSFIETTVAYGLSHFSDYPGASAQLASLPKMPFGVSSDDDSQSLQARSISIPFASMMLVGLPCGGARIPKFCFDAMSEHFGQHWNTGSGDLMQPSFLLWKASPKMCLLKGAVGAVSSMVGPDSPMCSVPLMKFKFPPSQLPVCTPWGVMFPRYGTVEGPSDIMGALTMDERIKSLAVEVLRSMPSSPAEKWQFISPSSSMCFREFEQMAALETFKLANNRGRLIGKDLQGNLVATWDQVSCVKEWPEVPFYEAQIAILESICKGAP